MNGSTWLVRLRGVQLSVLLALVQEQYSVHTAVQLASVVGYSRQRVAWALDVLTRDGLVYRVHRTGWRCSVSAVEFVHGLFTGVDTLRQGHIMSHSTSDNVTVGENGRSADGAQSHIMSHSMSNNIPLGLHDYDHDDDDVDIVNYRVLRLEEIGFQNVRLWLVGKDGALVDEWLDWELGLDGEARSRFRNVGGFIRRRVEGGQRPSFGGRVGNRTPLSMVGFVKR